MKVLVDIDGTLAIRRGRSPFEWDKAEFDAPNLPVVEVVRGLSLLGHEVVYVSGRHEELRGVTDMWISQFVQVSGTLLMRTSGDNRPDEQIKAELVRNAGIELDTILLVLDDRDRVVNMWRRELGLVCLHVAEGDF